MKFWKGHFKLLRSLQWRLVYIFVSMCILLVSVVYVVINSGLKNIYYDNFKSDMNSRYESWLTSKGISESNVRVLAEEDIINGFHDGGDSKLFIGVNSEILSMTIFDVEKMNTGTKGIVYTTINQFADNPEELGNQLICNSTKILMPLNAGTEMTENKSLIDSIKGSKSFEYVKYLEGSNLAFYFTYAKEDWEQILERFNNLIFTSAAIAVLLSLFLGFLLSKTITSPIISIMHKAEHVAEGEFDQQLMVKSDDEIGNLTKTFNYMAKKLKNTLSEISSERNKVVTILNYMADGVIAFNLSGEVIHSNPASNKILGNDIEGKHFKEFADNLGLDIKIENIVYLEESPVREIDTIIDDMYAKVYFAVFTDTNKKPEGIIVVIHDVTEQQKLDNMRREFVANVSHELRTPITSIKSYTETLLDGALEDEETTNRFLNVINSEADRMTRLVKDLLQLSRLDNQQMSWNMDIISIKNIVKSIVERMQLEAGQKSQKLESFTIGDIPNIKGDKDRLEQVVVNLISNALKYTPENGVITVYLGKIYNDIYVKVTDTGIGIPSDSLPRIFERFYRVDKARSRDLGGTGLGLSIAKEIVQAHGGTIEITSEVGKGTEVTVRLPVNV